MKKYKKHIAVFFLIFFVSIKLVGLHSLTHFDEKIHDNCDFCEYVEAFSKVPFTNSESVAAAPQTALYNHSKKIYYDYHYHFAQDQIDAHLFSRPPPII